MSMDNQFSPGTALDPTATVEVSISCRDLLDLDVFSRSDPMAVVYHQPMGGTTSQWVEFQRTEVIFDCLNPDFVTKVQIDYHFEEEQALRFEVYDIDNPSASLDLHDFIGYAECTLGQIVAAGYNGLSQPLIQKKTRYNPHKVPKQPPKQSNGKIVLVAEELVQFKEEVTLTLKGHAMGSSRCCILTPSVFYTLSKATEAGSFTVVYRSEVSEGENPIWSPMTISIRSLCNGDKDRGVQFQFCRVGFNGYHTTIGFVYTTFNKMKALAERQGIKLVGKNGTEKAKATLEILPLDISPIYTFFEYIGGGTQIHCCFAIDYTASNGDPADPSSLHHISQVADKTNPYEQAIQAVGEIMQDYDPSKMFPVYGFGARIPPTGEVSNNFAVTLEDSPYCKGIDGVLDAYRNCIRQVQLYGPTNFAPIIKNVAALAKQDLEGGSYYVLLIITDGIITDMKETTEAIVEASRFPLSIIIVGVGSANFQQMDILDGDIVRLSANGVFAERDIVQFVPYRDHHSWMATICPEIAGKWSSSFDITRRLAKVKLAQEVLAEIPDQLTGFMKSRNIIPKKRQPSATTSSPIKSPTSQTSPVPSTSNGNASISSKPNTAKNSL
ncbi:copine-9 [Folsomia candida]|uniref:copine-9 n=1 Tax=Folsomia candida TaxID=158441 RepID=UPI001604D09F|nr:copine-9 [Folsomia candida]